ncbi:helix-turn-helix domain-containing protein, partial [Sansalvadorimonas verongulae]|uniref:helix-turn-helix domain-containing protein n=1 Tax=Sansalvadorimonas verongulae TaxID=2172824 RepID=UPI0012BBEBCD
MNTSSSISIRDVVNQILGLPALSNAQRVLLVAMASNAGSNGTCYMDLSGISYLLGANKSTVSRDIKRLKTQGFIDVKRRGFYWVNFALILNYSDSRAFSPISREANSISRGTNSETGEQETPISREANSISCEAAYDSGRRISRKANSISRGANS